MTKRIGSSKIKSVKTLNRSKKRSIAGLIIIVTLCIGLKGWDAVSYIDDRFLPESEEIIRIYNTETKQLMQISLESYLVGVVAAEMPVSFHPEALKAQAVAARTFTKYRIQHPNPNVTTLHQDAQITTNTGTCQAWIDDATQKARWGSQYTKWREKIIQAVSETAGEVLCYENMLIEPLYHASCGGGYTEAAEDVWGNVKPYLTSVACYHPVDKHSEEKIELSLAAFSKQMKVPMTQAVLASFPEQNLFQITQRTASNRVKEVRIGEERYSGTVVRSALGLKSTLFECELKNDTLVFTTNGYGHGVGMCQYGADYYAQLGYDYRQILQHYYPGTCLIK